MTTATPVARVNQLDGLSLGMFALSGLSFLTLSFLTIGLAGGAVLTLLGSSRLAVGDNPFYSFAWLAGFFALLTIPAIGFSFARLMGKDTSALELRASRQAYRLSMGLMIGWPLVLLAGQWLTQNRSFGWLFLPPLQIASIAIPLWWLIELTRRRLEGISAQRVWGAVNFSFLVSTVVILLVEIVVLIAALIMAGIVFASQPEWAAALERVAQRLSMARANPDVILRIVKPFLQQPLVLVALLAGAAGIVPLVEEFFKPLGLWLLAGRKMTPADGFILGAASGCGFALLESLGLLSNPAQSSWVVLAVGRMGTGLLHITASALVGWGLAVAWREGKYIQLGISYALAVFIHSIWNLFGLLMGIAPLLEPVSPQIWLVARLGQVAPLALAVLAASLLMILWVGNRILRPQGAKSW